MAAASAPRKRTTASKAPARRKLAPVHVHPAAPAGRFAELMQTVHIPDPYVITEELRVEPPTRPQMEAIMAAQAAFAIANSQLAELMEPIKVAKLDDKGAPVLDDEENPVMIERLPDVDPRQLEQIEMVTRAAGDRYNRALFGDAYGPVMDYFDTKPVQVWNSFYTDVQNTFMPVPESGACPTCGHVVDASAEGNEPASTPS